ncbi:MAG: sugar isomerase domain-containing protein [Propionibacteriaceae bacterium]|jgi:uncharacterized phosphosugar-binding protein|nr:sugar isomerase domain-containing protein [Propionibacteriaceae bacterium]
MPEPSFDAGLLSDWGRDLIAVAQRALEQEAQTVLEAARAVVERLAGGGRLLTFGAGHSWCLAAELCSRAGGLPQVVAMSLADLGPPRDQWLQLADSGPERDLALAAPLLEHHRVTGLDAVIVISNSGRNQAVVELARLAQQKGCLVVALVSRAHLDAVDSRHPSSTKLTDWADLVLDNQGQPGDAALEIAPAVQAGATSTLVGALLLQLLSCAAARLLADQGGFDTIRSANLDPMTGPAASGRGAA